MEKKVVIITGASSGIGRETALFLTKCGYRVYDGAEGLKNSKNLNCRAFCIFTPEFLTEK